MNSDNVLKIALIPAYQPDIRLAQLAAELKKNGFETVITDDGSGEAYRKYFAAASKYARVLSYPVNHGKGYALRTGIHYIIRKYSCDYTIVTLDSDGQHKINDVVEVTNKALENRGALVIGARQFDTEVPLRSRFGNTMTRFVFKLKTGGSVYDTQTGLRAFSSDLAEYIAGIGGNRYEYEMNMLMQCASDKKEIIEVPIKTIYIDDNKGSHFDPIRDSARIYKAIFSFRKK